LLWLGNREPSLQLSHLIEISKLRRRQRRLISDVERSSICYSDGSATSLEDPVAITGAAWDIEGSAAILAWLIGKHGTMDVDWRVRIKRGHHDNGRHIDMYVIRLRSREEKTYYFDVSESYGKLPH
jgi:hypothetical protein